MGNGTPGSCTEGALNAALAGGGSVTFNCGGSPVVIPITSQKVVSVATTVDGGNADLVILDAGGATRHFTTTQTISTVVSLTIRNLTLRNGRCPVPDPGQPSPGYGGSIRSGIDSPLTVQDSRFVNNVCDVAGVDVGGGAIRQRRGALLVQRTLFQGNRAGNAGGISSSDAVVTIEDSTFTGNTTNAHGSGFSGVGGGFYNDESGNGLVTIRRTVFTNNTATFAAGAIQSFFVPGDQGLVLEDCTFTNNSSPGDGGAVLSQTGPLTVSRSTFSGNSANNGAGIYINTSPATIINSTFSGNTAGNVGGGIFAGNSPVTVSHTTIAGNLGGLGLVVSGGGGSLRGSIVASNAGGQCSGSLSNAGGNLQFPSTGTCAGGVTVADPQLGPLASNGGFTQTRAIASSSPARDLVTSGCPPPATDQRGVSRPANACDAGSFELSGTVGIGNETVTEGTGGTTTATFDVTLSASAAQTVTIGYATANGTATAGADYTAASGVVTFPPGTTARTVNVQVTSDALDENDETFTVTLSNASGATIGNATGTGTIQDDDAPPSVSVADCGSAEGALCGFAVALSAASGKTVTVPFSTANGSAQAGSDYVAASGTLTVPAGSTQAFAFVQTLQDAVDEVDESYLLNLGAPGNATVGDGQASGFIDDDDGPQARVNDVATTEGTAASFTVSLSASSPQVVTVDFSTSDGTADAGSDYTAASGTLTFPAGTVTRTVSVPTSGDAADEPNESYFLNLTGVTEASIGDPSGLGTILDNDGGAIVLRGLAHGSRLRDGFAGGADLFTVDVPARSSWEVVLDEASGDASSGGPLLQRVDNDTSTVLQSSVAAGTGTARSLVWRNTTNLAQVAYVRVASSQCTAGCGPDDTYRLRAYETTLRAPRFNNGGNQVTILVLQNSSSATVAGTAYFWSATGALLGQHPFTLSARGSTTVNTAGVAGVSGQAGSVSITHNGRYGALTGKTVALETTTGFSFDATAAPPPR